MQKKRLGAWISITALALLCCAGYGLLVELPAEEILIMIWWVLGGSGMAACMLWLGHKESMSNNVKYTVLEAESDWESGFSTRSGRPLRNTYHSRKVDQERQKYLDQNKR